MALLYFSKTFTEYFVENNLDIPEIYINSRPMEIVGHTIKAIASEHKPNQVTYFLTDDNQIFISTIFTDCQKFSNISTLKWETSHEIDEYTACRLNIISEQLRDKIIKYRVDQCISSYKQ